MYTVIVINAQGASDTWTVNSLRAVSRSVRARYSDAHRLTVRVVGADCEIIREYRPRKQAN